MDLPEGVRVGFCPVCSLRGALELEDAECETPETEVARHWGDYELVEPMGRGGMGIVWRARQRSLDRWVAVKLIADGELSTPDARRRFHEEARAAAQLRHPNIVGIHEIGEQDGQPFFSMDLVEGATVAERVSKGPLAVDEAVEILSQVTRAVAFAHEQGVLHRDLKPANLLMEADGTVRVSDFGLSRPMDSRNRMTLAGDILGSPAYLAPEQARGDRRAEGAGTDIHALGAILYELMTGRPPFVGESPAAVLQQVLNEEPIPPAMLNPRVPIDLQCVCLKCLEKVPSHRYASAGELLEELERFTRGEPLRVRPLGPWARVWRWGLRHPVKAGLVFATVLLLLTLSIVPTMAYARVRKAELARVVQLRESLLAEARATRLAGRPGKRLHSLESLKRAAAMGGDDAFRLRFGREMIAALALEDVVVEPMPAMASVADPTLMRLAPDGVHAAVGGFRGPLRLVRLSDGGEVARIDLGGRTLQHILDFSGDGRFVATRHGGEIAVWDWSNRLEVMHWPSAPPVLAFRGDGGEVAVVRSDGSVTGHELPSGLQRWGWERGDGPRPVALAYRPGHLELACALAGNGGIELRRTEGGKVARKWDPGATIRVLAWDREGERLASGDDSGRVRAWNFLGAGRVELLREYAVHAGFVRALAWSADGHWLTSAGFDETVRLLDTRLNTPGLVVQGETFQLMFALSGLRLGPIWQGRKPVWVTLMESDVHVSLQLGNDVGRDFSVALDGRGKRLAVTQAGETSVWDTESWRRRELLRVVSGRFVAFTPDDALLAVTKSGVFRQGKRGAELESLLAAGGDAVFFDRGAETLGLRDFESGRLRVFRAGTLGLTITNDRVSEASMSFDGRWLAAATLDEGKIRVWDARTGGLVREWADEGNANVVFSPDGRWLAHFGIEARFWDTQVWEARRPRMPLAPNSRSGAGAFSRDGRWFALVTGDSEVQLLSAPGWVSMVALESPRPARIKSVVWSGDGSRLAATTASGEIQVWNVARIWKELEHRLGSVLKVDE